MCGVSIFEKYNSKCNQVESKSKRNPALKAGSLKNMRCLILSYLPNQILH